MRRFHSYGPVYAEQHFCVARTDVVNKCMDQLIGDPNTGGHYFTVWGARQTGKTWLMRQMEQVIPEHYGEQFSVFSFSVGNLRDLQFIPEQSERHIFPQRLTQSLANSLPDKPDIKSWGDFGNIFLKNGGLWDRPLILMIDEVDTLPPHLLDLIVSQFRDLYLKRDHHWLHGLILTGVRAVVGIESKRGSPFNVQRSLHVPNLTRDEVIDLYQQYQQESGQSIEPEIVTQVYDETRGQPGLVSWFGELMTETYNPARTDDYVNLPELGKFKPLDPAELPKHPITMNTWEWVWHRARHREVNNTLMNLIAKAREEKYQPFLIKMFGHADIPFSFHKPLHNYLYMHGIMEPEIIELPNGKLLDICRFSTPFIQDCLYDALGDELVTQTDSVLSLHPLDELEDVFEPPDEAEDSDDYFNLPKLLERYKDYLVRLKEKGLNPWKSQPRRKTDLQLTEAVGHFHLYAWLVGVMRECVVSPEFPTGNGKIDIHIRCGEKRGIIEVKSFVDMSQFKKERKRAAKYAKNMGLSRLTMAVFLPMDDPKVLTSLTGEMVIEGIKVSTVAIGWV